MCPSSLALPRSYLGSLCLRRFSTVVSVSLRSRGSRTEYRLRFNLYANECLVFTEPRADRLCFGHNFRVSTYNKRGDCGRSSTRSLAEAAGGALRLSDFRRRECGTTKYAFAWGMWTKFLISRSRETGVLGNRSRDRVITRAKKLDGRTHVVTNDATISIHRPSVFLLGEARRPAHVPLTAFYKFPKAVIDNGRRGCAHRQLDECAPLAFNYRSILSVQTHWSFVHLSVPSVRPPVGRSVCASGISGRNNIGRTPMLVPAA